MPHPRAGEDKPSPLRKPTRAGDHEGRPYEGRFPPKDGEFMQKVNSNSLATYGKIEPSH
ncbi:MAG TPA: hypothetical protein VEV19_15690 [Ktedonobacteraceae bacterium]|nr:hypothetical protein [Ktedonobacteraceae bacterium]